MKDFVNITTYDELIKKYHSHYELPFDWLLLKAQLMQESRLNPLAKSPVGALGLAQFMPDTWREYVARCGYLYSCRPTNPEASIHCCAAYMSDLLDKWTAKRSDIDRYNLALASYNAGFGNLLKAQRIVKMAPDYETIVSALKFVTGVENALQTTQYVVRIHEIHNKYQLIYNG